MIRWHDRRPLVPLGAAPGPAACRRSRACGRSRGASTTPCASCPIISPHGHVDPRLLLDDEPFRDPGEPVRHPRPLRHPAAARQRRRRWTRSASGTGRWPRTQARAAWRLLCSHWDVFRGTPVRFWLEAELADIFDVSVRPSARDRRRDLRPGRRAARGRTPTARARSTSGSASRCSPPPTTRATTCPRTPRSPPTRPGPGGSSRRSGPTATSSRRSPAGPDAVARLGEAADVDTGDYAGLRARAGGAAPVLRRARRDVGRPQPRRRPHRPARRRARPARIYRAALAGDATRGRGRRVPAAHAAGDGADVVRGRAGHDAASRRCAAATTARRRPRSAPTPATTSRCRVEFTDALRPLLERFGTHPGFHLVVVHPRRDRLLPRARPAGRLLPRRSTSACPGGSSTPRDAIRRFRAAVTETAGLLPHLRASSTTRARSARSRPATTCPAASTPAGSPSSWPSTGSTRTRPSRRRSTWSPGSRREVFKL